ncbi:MAG: oxygen-independent coproporphyrinogen III oxidase [Nevskiales bacterium]|nr:oxygen-independent coproporphyrinogen III oxidase [Nevskiales bacterium]
MSHAVQTVPEFKPDLIRRYSAPVPRYTSYPTALQFDARFGEDDLVRAIERSDTDPLSVYIHVPFCSSPCYYCGCTRLITRQPEKIEQYVKRLVHEIALQGQLFGRRRSIRQLHFGGGTPTILTASQFGRIIGALDYHFGLSESEDREYSIEIDPRTLEDETLAGLAALGFNRVSFGVQDLNADVQDAINRVQPAELSWRAIRQAREAGFKSVSLDLIYGLPKQTLESFTETLAAVADAGPDRIAVYAYAHMPHLFKAQRQIRLKDLPTPDQRMELLQRSIEFLTSHGYVYIGMDHFARPDDDLARALEHGDLQRNFQGYSTQGGSDLLGLGMSAISRIGDCYSQNTKDMKQYNAAVDSGHLPIERGLWLSPEDQLRRRVIEDLMCRGQVDTRAVERDYGVRFERHFAHELQRLMALEQDGLVCWEHEAIRVTPAGRLLARNVAQVFDAYSPPPTVTGVQRHAQAI